MCIYFYVDTCWLTLIFYSECPCCLDFSKCEISLWYTTYKTYRRVWKLLLSPGRSILFFGSEFFSLQCHTYSEIPVSSLKESFLKVSICLRHLSLKVLEVNQKYTLCLLSLVSILALYTSSDFRQLFGIGHTLFLR